MIFRSFYLVAVLLSIKSVAWGACSRLEAQAAKLSIATMWQEDIAYASDGRILGAIQMRGDATATWLYEKKTSRMANAFQLGIAGDYRKGYKVTVRFYDRLFDTAEYRKRIQFFAGSVEVEFGLASDARALSDKDLENNLLIEKFFLAASSTDMTILRIGKTDGQDENYVVVYHGSISENELPTQINAMHVRWIKHVAPVSP